VISHVSLGVRDLSQSTAFYDAMMAPLGYRRPPETKPSEAAYGPDGSAIFWLYETAGDGSLAGPGTHIAFQATSRDALHEAARSAKDAGSTFTREPGLHPDIAPDYYGAVFLDPDGHKVELVVEAAD
jgi:catechol 2,3-dioxygenase-like lactoylglutathione lyase family enzyme